MRIPSLGREDPLEKAWQPTPLFLPGKSQGQRSLVGYSPWGHKESDMTECLNKENGLYSQLDSIGNISLRIFSV